MLAKRFVFQWLGRTIPGPVAIAAEDNQWWHVSIFDHAVVTDASQSGVRIRRRDKQKLKQADQANDEGAAAIPHASACAAGPISPSASRNW